MSPVNKNKLRALIARLPGRTKMKPPQIALLLFIFVLAGRFLPWWGFVVPAVFAGAWAFRMKHKISTIALTAAGAWLLASIYHDAVASWRISAKVAAVIHLPLGLFLYVITIVIAAGLAALAAGAGAALMEILMTEKKITRPVGRLED